MIVLLTGAIALGVLLDEIGEHLNTQRGEPGLAMEHVEGTFSRLPVRQDGDELTILQEGVHIVLRGVDDAEVALGCPHGGLGLVDAKAGCALDADRLFVPPAQLPVLVGPAIDEIVLFQLGRVGGHTHLLQIEGEANRPYWM